ncbi:MAG: DUF262 domain-containing protein [Clostridia bacterium]|nr:DUF262 domain-containing protein [Clostridia bacterium]
MSFYQIETWTLRDVAKAFGFKSTVQDPKDRKVVVPMFQRGLRWDKKRKQSFIESLEKGYPFGSLLFAKQQGINTYSVVDGLQRGSTVSEYYENPFGEDNISNINGAYLDAVRKILYPNSTTESLNASIETDILDYLHRIKKVDKVELFDLADELFEKHLDDSDTRDRYKLAKQIINALTPFIDESRQDYDDICNAPVPIVVYSGPLDQLSEIFKRINTQGIVLSDYDIFAATWSEKKYVIDDPKIVQKVIDKYMVLQQASFQIDGFDATQMALNKQLTAFELLFGLGKLWPEKYDCLKCDTEGKPDEINEISFLIVDACLSNSRSIADLHTTLQKYDVNQLILDIQEAILFVDKAIAIVGKFKGNRRKDTTLHSKYQIVSLIANTFREMYDASDLFNKRATWDNAFAKSYQQSILGHYVADVITNEWYDGGRAKIYQAINDHRFTEPIPRKQWELYIDTYYQRSMAENSQHERFSNPRNADSVVLNCVYVNVFSASDQLSTEKFDIEHLATKDRMRKLIKPYADLRLPVSCIANYCYLPENINRSKGEKTIYEDAGLTTALTNIEQKYSFTQASDFDWLYESYGANDKDKLVQNYQAYLDARFKIMRQKFLDFVCPSEQ